MFFIQNSLVFNAISNRDAIKELLHVVRETIPTVQATTNNPLKIFPFAVVRFEKLQNRDWEVYNYLFEWLLLNGWEIVTVYMVSYTSGATLLLAPVHGFKRWVSFD